MIYNLVSVLFWFGFQKFFGTIRQAAGCNEHPTCSTFLHLYKILSVYSVLKPPKYGNCIISENKISQFLITVNDLKQVYDKKNSKYVASRQRLKDKLDTLITNEEWEVDDLFNDDHDYSLAPVIDCIIYYTTGYHRKSNFFAVSTCTVKGDCPTNIFVYCTNLHRHKLISSSKNSLSF